MSWRRSRRSGRRASPDDPWHAEQAGIPCAVRRVGERILDAQRRPRIVRPLDAERRVHMRRRRNACRVDSLQLFGIVQDVGQLSREQQLLVVGELQMRERGNTLDVGNRQGGHSSDYVTCATGLTICGHVATVLFALALVTSPVQAMDRQDIGLTAKGGTIRAAIVRGSSDSAPVVALVGGLSGEDASSRAVMQAIDEFDKQPQAKRPYTLIDRDARIWKGQRSCFHRRALRTRQHGVARAVAVDWNPRAGSGIVAGADAASSRRRCRITLSPASAAFRRDAWNATARLLQAIPQTIVESEARREINGRRRRSPRQLADELSRVFGQDFEQFTYIPGMALIGRLRLGQTADVERLVAPYVNGSRNPLDRPNSSCSPGIS